jgi:hypothetical protein
MLSDRGVREKRARCADRSPSMDLFGKGMGLDRETREKRVKLNMDLGLRDFLVEGLGLDGEIREKREKDVDLEDIDYLVGGSGKNDPIGSLQGRGLGVDGAEIFDAGCFLSVTIETPPARRDELELLIDRACLIVKISNLGFKKAISLPSEVVREGSRATYKNGVLDIVLKKACYHKK